MNMGPRGFDDHQSSDGISDEDTRNDGEEVVSEEVEDMSVADGHNDVDDQQSPAKVTKEPKS